MTQIKERGFTLISMMIGLTIGAFLLFGLYDIWAQMRRTFTAQDLSSNLQDNERMALAIIANTLQTAGYYPNYLNFQTPLPAGAPFSADSFTPDPGANPAPPPPFATRQSIAGTYSNAAPGDTLWVRFIADNNTLDCLGQANAGGTLVSNAFFVNNGNLWCSVNGGTPEPIVTGVANLSVLYGVDTFGDESVHQYMTAIQVTAASRWNSVRSADIQLTFNNPLDGQPGQAPTLAPVRRIVPIAQTTSSP